MRVCCFWHSKLCERQCLEGVEPLHVSSSGAGSKRFKLSYPCSFDESLADGRMRLKSEYLISADIPLSSTETLALSTATKLMFQRLLA